MSINKITYTEKDSGSPSRFDLEEQMSYVRHASKKFLQKFESCFKDSKWLDQIDKSITAKPSQSSLSCKKRDKKQLQYINSSLYKKLQKDPYALAKMQNSYILAQRICRDYNIAMKNRKQRILNALDQSLGIALINAKTKGSHI